MIDCTLVMLYCHLVVPSIVLLIACGVIVSLVAYGQVVLLVACFVVCSSLSIDDTICSYDLIASPFLA